ncbi:MAG TPA: KR domain-containing protein, partial [Polyangiales bacterium]|nr:KR domain-containing protein [Polyangiales bacterium]
SRVEAGAWQRHAVGRLGPQASLASVGFDALRDWTALAAEPVDLEGFYERLRARGLEYGASFKGLVELKRAENCAYARVVLPESARAAAADHELHPALLDAALHSLVLLGVGDDAIALPFAWEDVQLLASGATELRARVEVVRNAGQRVASLWLADAEGAPIARIGGLRVRPLGDKLLQPDRSSSEHLFRVVSQPVLLGAGDQTPSVVIGGDGRLAHVLAAAWYPDLDAYLEQLTEADRAQRLVIDATAAEGAHSALETAALAERATLRVQHVLQRLLEDARLHTAQCVCVTSNALPGSTAAAVDLVHAPLWGLVRAARNEHPERTIRLLDLSSAPDALERELLERALSAQHEPELVLDAEHAHALRLARVVSAEPAPVALGSGCVLVTGGTGELGALLAHHLVQVHGVQRLVLTSRQGEQAPSAAALIESLLAAGAQQVLVRACDVSDRAQLSALLYELGGSLCAVFHLSAVLEDGLLGGQTPERLARVFAPKVTGALLLDELTRGVPLTAFVLYSSASGTLGGVGQSNYAAANLVLDGLAARRRAQGLVATSIAWGLWQPSGTGLTAKLTDADMARMARNGIAPLTAAQGLRALDAALASGDAHMLAIRLEVPALQRAADQGAAVPALMRGLVRVSSRQGAPTHADVNAFQQRMLTQPADERLQALEEIVRREVATVLGLSSPQAVDPDKELAKLGLDSLMAVEVRNRLSARAGVSLPATLAFDYPTPRAIAQLLEQRLRGERATRTSVERAPSHTRHEPIAIIGMSCRLPGGIDTPEGYWELLERGGDAIEGFPERWSELDVYDADPDAAGKTYAREGGFVHGVD